MISTIFIKKNVSFPYKKLWRRHVFDGTTTVGSCEQQHIATDSHNSLVCSFLLPDRWEWDSPDTNVTADAPCLLLATWGEREEGGKQGRSYSVYLPLPPREKWGGELSIQVAATRTRAAFNYFLLGCLTHCAIPHNYTILDIKSHFGEYYMLKSYLQNKVK